MKNSCCIFGRPFTIFVATMLLLFLTAGEALRAVPEIPRSSNEEGNSMEERSPETPRGEGSRENVVLGETYATGSTLPDCSHACGPCFPCKRVMVSFTCSLAESCPIVYRCMCQGKYYHVPSN